MINIFINQVPEFIVELKTLYNNKDYTELSKAAHKAKSSVSIVGMNQLADNLKTLEMLAKEGISPEKYKDIIDSFEFNCNSACEELKYYLQTVENRWINNYWVYIFIELLIFRKLFFGLRYFKKRD